MTQFCRHRPSALISPEFEDVVFGAPSFACQTEAGGLIDPPPHSRYNTLILFGGASLILACPQIELQGRRCPAYIETGATRLTSAPNRRRGSGHAIGEDVTETLEVVPRQWFVIEHVREKSRSSAAGVACRP